jgi:pimeloyl-ACP methyl ester carboxylesterase
MTTRVSSSRSIGRRAEHSGAPARLAIGGAESSGEGATNTMKLVADDVQGVVLPDSGHWVAEQAPEALLDAMTKFLAPYRDGTAAGHKLATA